jgi:hypothetical protein
MAKKVVSNLVAEGENTEAVREVVRRGKRGYPIVLSELEKENYRSLANSAGIGLIEMLTSMIKDAFLYVDENILIEHANTRYGKARQFVNGKAVALKQQLAGELGLIEPSTEDTSV